MRTEEVEREREKESTSIRAILPIPPLNRQQIVTSGNNGMSGHPIPNPSGAEAIVSDR